MQKNQVCKAVAIGFFLIPPAISFVILFLSPKSPVWLISCNRHKEAIESLTILRGQENQEIVKVETKQIQQNFEANLNESETSWASRLRQFVSLLKDPTFLKPLSILLLLFPIGMSWSGLISIGKNLYIRALLQRLFLRCKKITVAMHIISNFKFHLIKLTLIQHLVGNGLDCLCYLADYIFPNGSMIFFISSA